VASCPQSDAGLAELAQAYGQAAVTAMATTATDAPTLLARFTTLEIPLLPTSKCRVNILSIQFKDVIIVIEEVQSPVGTSPYELEPHCLQSGDGSLENFRCGAKGNVVPGPGMLHGGANEHNPDAAQSDERFEMTLFVLTLNRLGAEQVMKERGCPNGIFYYEGKPIAPRTRIPAVPISSISNRPWAAWT
jgi:hypothetical protein